MLKVEAYDVGIGIDTGLAILIMSILMRFLQRVLALAAVVLQVLRARYGTSTGRLATAKEVEGDLHLARDELALHLKSSRVLAGHPIPVSPMSGLAVIRMPDTAYDMKQFLVMVYSRFPEGARYPDSC
ncbi:hypothetical protein L227DRAFT_333140 [Lentinus tigrinus ALCF2SS1-6]|uniref:Uncharacterized protein n=1 Tax=Lentinus tigrinus ALCF2SS1-6 TaxID=1328759 RepID=A0A5C2RWW0_9APHY|nr:hypothetical protein L227DRAFT_333140 [Lentinus tigrinus ALCF2SS1-6]